MSHMKDVYTTFVSIAEGYIPSVAELVAARDYLSDEIARSTDANVPTPTPDTRVVSEGYDIVRGGVSRMYADGTIVNSVQGADFTVYAVTRGKTPRRELYGFYADEADAEKYRDQLNETYPKLQYHYQVTPFTVQSTRPADATTENDKG